MFSGSAFEIVLGVVGSLGIDNKKIRSLLAARLAVYGYRTNIISIAGTIIPALQGKQWPHSLSEFNLASKKIEAGNSICRRTKNNAILAIASAAEIARTRPSPRNQTQRVAHIITSLKRPDEVAELRKIYGNAFYLIAVHSEGSQRTDSLVARGSGMNRWQAEKLVGRDENEDNDHGQKTRKTFELADFFLADENNDDKLKYSMHRCLDLVFGNPHLTPTFNEFAMFMAFASAVRSADLSRQVGAVIAKGKEIIATGANDCPCAGGGLYWPSYIGDRVDDHPRGRDYKRGVDSNAVEKAGLIRDIVGSLSKGIRREVERKLRASRIRDITEYGRVVHAEMEALLACARSGISSVGATLYCTTFPCHNCAKHIIAAGIEQVLYIEPYPKSKAFKFHDDALTSSKGDNAEKVRFKPFVGIGPRQFFDLFSQSLSSGRLLDRKDKQGKAKLWRPDGAIPRVPVLPFTYRQLERAALQYLRSVSGGQSRNVRKKRGQRNVGQGTR